LKRRRVDLHLQRDREVSKQPCPFQALQFDWQAHCPSDSNCMRLQGDRLVQYPSDIVSCQSSARGQFSSYFIKV
jgi:hypothetical protein